MASLYESNPAQRYRDALGGLNYYGSSGYWASDPTMGPYGGNIPGYGYPGSRSRAAIARLYGMQPDPADAAAVRPLRSWQEAGGGRGPTLEDLRDPAKRYRAVEVIKSPAVAAATDDLMKQFQANASSALKDFSAHIPTFTSDVERARQLGLQATDVNPTIAALTGAQTRYEGDLDTATAGYRGALDQGAAAQRGIVNQAYAELPAYDLAAQNIANRQMDEARRNIARYRLASGTPTSLGSDEQAMLARAAQDVLLPTEMAKIQQRYNIMGSYALPVERDITGREVAYQGSYLPSVAGSKYSSATSTANAIQALRNQVAGMSYDNATRYMQAMNIPWQVQQQILSGQISELGGLAQLEEASRYRGLQDVLGVNVSQPQYYNMSLPYFNPRYGGGGTGGGYIPYYGRGAALGGGAAPGTLNAPVVVGSDGRARYATLPAWALASRASEGVGVMPGQGTIPRYYPSPIPNYVQPGMSTYTPGPYDDLAGQNYEVPRYTPLGSMYGAI